MNRNESSGDSTVAAESTATFQQQAYDHVKAQILNLKFKPGQLITDSQLAADLGISRTPVREALRRLEQEGLVIDQARRGWKVYTLALEDIHEIFDIKEALDGMIIRKAAECQDAGLRSALTEAIGHMQRATEADDLEGWQEADTELHDIIYAMGGNERATRIMRGVNEQWYRLRIGFLTLQGRMQRSTPEHEAIVASILAGEGQEAERLHGLHTNRVRHALVRVLVNLVLPFVDEGV